MKIKGCPICGEKPDISYIGSCIDIECCVSMSIQKVDYLTIEEWKTWIDNPCYQFSAEVEDKVLALALDQWNQRAESVGEYEV